MQLFVILLVSVIGLSLGDVLKVKCGDETCEKPSNRAVTTLRYTPDKPYKLTINAVNAEVEIYGATEDLFYIRHGRNYGFLPKNHLREKARGNFLHDVEIDIGAFKINQEVRERNFLHEFLKSSHHSEDSHDHSHSHANEIVDIQKSVQDNITEEAPAKTNEERATEYIPIGIEPKISLDEPAEKLTFSNDTVNSNEINDSGMEDDDNDDDDDEDEEDDSADVFDKEEESVENIKQNEVVEKPKNVEVKPASIDVETEEILNITATSNNNDDSTTQNPIVQTEIIEEVDVLTQTNDIETMSIDKEEPAEIIKEEETLTTVLENNVVEIIKEHEIIQEEIPLNITVEKPVHEHADEGNFEIPEVTTESSIADPLPPPPEIEVTTETSVSEQEVVSTTESPENNEILSSETVTEENSTASYQEVIPNPPQENQASQNEDILLKRFDQKLTHKNHESEGVGSVEEMHAHSHDHSHSHFTHNHNSHSHDHHSHEEEQVHKKSDEVSNDVSNNEEVPLENDNNKKPGFLGGLFKKIFGDANESSEKTTSTLDNVDEGFCEKIDSENCPKSFIIKSEQHIRDHQDKDNLKTEAVEKTLNKYLSMAIEEAVSKMDLIISLALTALTTLIFIFGYYCINRARKEGPLIARMNELERHLMAAVKENEMLKADVLNTKQKLVSIEDNSFGSNDMVIALKHEIEESEKIKFELSEKICSMEKELEAAAEDGLELNRMVSELLSNQSGSESIISSVEELQHQLNEQQETIITMNDALAAKSRENSVLQIQLSEVNSHFHKDMEQLQQKIDALTLERSNLQLDLENIKRESDIQVNQIIEERNGEVTRLNKELTSYAGKYDDTRKLLNGAESKVQALQECLETIKKSKGGDFKKIIDVADLRADLLAVTKENSILQEQSQTERDAKKLMEDRVKTISEEMSSLKKEFGAAEKEKLEALTRLDVLSAYFKETESRLQLELSDEKARGMKQQGETMSTVEKVQALNDEIQGLKSQNDSLRAEIEAQLSAHKLNISSIEGQAHSAWLNARQAERKLEESRMEAAALRRRLTSIAENPSGSTADLMNGLPGNESMNSVSSPHRVESPNMSSMPPVMNMNMPAMPPFMPGPPPFMQMPPFMLSNQAGLSGLPPLGRLMSPPPNRFTPTDRDHRYSPRRGHRYSPESRYDDYTAFETETDYSPPPSPRRGYNSPSDRNNKKGGHSSAGSADSSNKPSRRK